MLNKANNSTKSSFYTGEEHYDKETVYIFADIDAVVARSMFIRPNRKYANPN